MINDSARITVQVWQMDLRQIEESRTSMSSKLEASFARLDAAMSRLETAIAENLEPGEIVGDVTPEIPVLRAERDELASEIKLLRDRAAKDAELRAEAATAVREALADLRGAVGEGNPGHA